MRYALLVPIAAAVILVLNLLAVSGADVSAAQGGTDLCVAISGGTVQNATVLDVTANGGTGIGDASGGNGNLAVAADGGNDNSRHNGNNGNNDNGNRNNNNNNNHHNWTSESLPAFEQRLLQTDTASSGNGGVATASGNGGVVSISDINSGGNAGNAISVGDTHCPGAAPQKPSGGGGGNAAPSGGGGGGGRGGKVKALPNTGVGMVEDATSESLLL